MTSVTAGIVEGIIKGIIESIFTGVIAKACVDFFLGINPVIVVGIFIGIYDLGDYFKCCCGNNLKVVLGSHSGYC